MVIKLVPWMGGKHGLINDILPLFPIHHTYIEVFGGGASFLFAKPLSAVEIYNDLDGMLVNLFRVIRDDVKFGKFQKLCSYTLYSRSDYMLYKEKIDTFT